MKTWSRLGVGTFSYPGDVKCSSLKSLFVDITHSLVILTSCGGRCSSCSDCVTCSHLSFRGSSLLANGASACWVEAGSLFSPRCAGLLALPVNLVSVCCHTWFALLHKILLLTLWRLGCAWLAQWNQFQKCKKKTKENTSLFALTADIIGEILLTDFTEIFLMKINPYEMLYIIIAISLILLNTLTLTVIPNLQNNHAP